MMKKITIIIFCFWFWKGFYQENKKLAILTNTKNWNKEIIKFPIDWAPNLKLLGFEELRFAPNWNKPKHNNFWSLIMAWSIDAKAILPNKLIIKNFKGYFDGLMKPNHWAENFPEPTIKFTNKSGTNAIFTMTFFDGFHTGKVMTVNVKMSQIFCETAQRAFVTFYISPKKQNDKIWKTLKEITVDPKLCNPNEKADLIKVDSTWKKEIFPFPIRFAKSIPYEGFEEARFPPEGWLDKNHPNFWSYTFAWKIHKTEVISKTELEENLKIYFDGLNNHKNFNTTASLTTVKTEKNTITFQGKVLIYDRFTTNEKLLLNVIIESILCKISKKTLVLFKFSPKSFDHETWKMLGKITLRKRICN